MYLFSMMRIFYEILILEELRKDSERFNFGLSERENDTKKVDKSKNNFIYTS